MFCLGADHGSSHRCQPGHVEAVLLVSFRSPVPTSALAKRTLADLHLVDAYLNTLARAAAFLSQVPVEKCGYYEDRRPASNLDPYVVTRLIVETTLLL